MHYRSGVAKPFSDMTSELIDFFQKAPIALHWLSGTGTVLWANDTELESLGYSAEEYIGHSITEFLQPGEEAHLQEVFGNLACGKIVAHLTTISKHGLPILMITTNNHLMFASLCATGKTVHDAPFRFRAKNGDIKYLVVDSNVNFNEDGRQQ